MPQDISGFLMSAGLQMNRGAGQTQSSSKPTNTSHDDIPIPPHAYDEMELFASQGRRFQTTTSSHGPAEDALLAAAVRVAATGAAEPTPGGAPGDGVLLGDLASLTSASALDNLDGVGVVAQSLVVDEEDEALVKVKAVLPSWTAKYNLRSHFDAVRSVVFHHADQILLTGSEDCTLRLWKMAKRGQPKKSSCLDVEPVRPCILFTH